MSVSSVFQSVGSCMHTVWRWLSVASLQSSQSDGETACGYATLPLCLHYPFNYKISNTDLQQALSEQQQHVLSKHEDERLGRAQAWASIVIRLARWLWKFCSVLSQSGLSTAIGISRNNNRSHAYLAWIIQGENTLHTFCKFLIVKQNVLSSYVHSKSRCLQSTLL